MKYLALMLISTWDAAVQPTWRGFKEILRLARQGINPLMPLHGARATPHPAQFDTPAQNSPAGPFPEWSNK